MGFMFELYLCGYLMNLISSLCYYKMASHNRGSITVSCIGDSPSATLGHVGGGGVGVVGGLVVPVGRVPLCLPAVVEAALVRTGGSPVSRGAGMGPTTAAAGAPTLQIISDVRSDWRTV